MLELRLLDSVAQVSQADWDSLVGPDDSPFVEWTWLDCMEQAGCVGKDSGWFPLHAALYDGEKPIAAAPCYIKTNSEGEFVFDWGWADFAHRIGVPYYPKLICAVPFTPATGARILCAPDRTPESKKELIQTLSRAFIEHAAKLGVRGVHILFPTEAEAALHYDAGYLCRYGVQYHFYNRGYRLFEDFLKDLPSKKRTQIRREMKQPAQDGVTIETLKQEEYTPALAKTMYELYLTTVDKFTWGRRYLNRRFFELVAERFAHRLAWVVARRDGKIIASAFNVKRGKRLYGRYWGTFTELPFLHYNVCYYHGIKECIAEGLDVFEPGAGGEHKRARGFLPTITYSAHHLEDRRLRAPLAEFLERERAAIRAHIDDPNSSEE